jgi:hypothetical protein
MAEDYKVFSKLKELGLPFDENIKEIMNHKKKCIDENKFSLKFAPSLGGKGVSIGPDYNPYKYTMNIIQEKELYGWDNKVQILNSYYETDYHMFRIKENEEDKYYVVCIQYDYKAGKEVVTSIDRSWTTFI